AAQHVAPEAVGAEEGLEPGRSLDEVEVLVVGRLRRERAGENRDHHDDRDAQRSRQDHAAVGDPAELAAPTKPVRTDGRGGHHPSGRDFHGGDTRPPPSACQGRHAARKWAGNMPKANRIRFMIDSMRWTLVPLVLTALVVSSPGAFAQPPDTVFLEELTWSEVRDAIRGGKTTIILPTGGTEQNGPHMALGHHNARAKIPSERIARALGTALVAPVVAYVPEGAINPPTGHMRFPGTITTPEDAFEKVLESAARSFRQHGFRDIVFLGDHGSTQAGQKAVAARLNREWASGPARVHAVEEYYRLSESETRQMLRAKGYRDEELGRHA